MTTLTKAPFDLMQVLDEHEAFYKKLNLGFKRNAFEKILTDKKQLIETASRFYAKPKILCLEPMLTRTNPRLLAPFLGIDCSKNTIQILANMRNSKFHFPHVSLTEGLLNMSESKQQPQIPRTLFKESDDVLIQKIQSAVLHHASRATHTALLLTYFDKNVHPRETMLIEEYLLLVALTRPRMIDTTSRTILVKEIKIEKVGNELRCFVPVLETKIKGTTPTLSIHFEPLTAEIRRGYYRKTNIYKQSL